VLSVLNTLRGRGYQAFIVGGAVRDLLMKIPIKDFDVATDALPEAVEALFPKTVDLGKEFGVIAVVSPEGVSVEVTTFREESQYNAKRQPTKVKYTDLEGDASRRDFTINALYYDVFTDRVIDPFGGVKDIQSRCLRAIGDAGERLKEDPLRVLRAIRFSARFDFVMEEDLKKALHQTGSLIAGVAKERVFDELKKAFQFHCWRRSLQLLDEFSLWSPLNWPVPSAERLRAVLRVSVDGGFLETLGWLWFDQPQEKMTRILRELKVSGKFKEALLFFTFEGKKLLQEPLPRLGERFLLFSRAPTGFLQFLKGLSELLGAREEFLKVRADFEAYRKLLDAHGELPRPLVDGEELQRQGIEKGPTMGALKKELYLRQLEGSFTSLKQLAKFLKEFPRTSSGDERPS